MLMINVLLTCTARVLTLTLILYFSIVGNRVISLTDFTMDLSCEGNVLKCVAWNMRSLQSGSPYLKELMLSNDIIAVSEHGLYNCQLWKVNELHCQFNSIAKSCKTLNDNDCGTKVGHSGVALLWRHGLDQYIKPIAVDSDRICAVELCLPVNQSLIIVSVYLPHKTSSVANFTEEVQILEGLLDQTHETNGIVIMGDINAHFGFEHGTRCWGETSYNGNAFSRFVDRNQLQIMDIGIKAWGPTYTFHSSTTHGGESYVDHVVVSSFLSELVSKCWVYNDCVANTSDHLPIGVWLSLQTNTVGVGTPNPVAAVKECSSALAPAWKRLSSSEIETLYTHPLEVKVSNLLQKYKQILHNDSFSNVKCLEEFLSGLLSSMRETSAENVPLITRKAHLKPYWTQQLTVLSKFQKACWHRWVSAGRPRDKNNKVWVEYKQAKKDFRRSQREEQHRFHLKQIENMCKQAELDQKGFWYVINKARKGKAAKVKPVKGEDGKLLTNPTEIAEDWRKYYENLFKEIEMGQGYDDDFYLAVVKSKEDRIVESLRRPNTITENKITDLEIDKIYKTLKTGKAAGDDGITNEHLKYSGPVARHACNIIFNSMIENEHIPQQFKTGLIVPIPKGGKRDICLKDNSRPITLLPVLYKVFEKILLERLDMWLTNNNIISQLQGAAQPRCSSTDVVVMLKETIAYHTEQGNNVCVVMLDTAKAFDSVWIEGLFYKMFHMGLEGRLWRLLRHSYEGFSCRVVVSGAVSEDLAVQRGVHQGAPLSMRLFQLFNNDLLTNLAKSEPCVGIYDLKTGAPTFADDLAIMTLFKPAMNKLLKQGHKHSVKWRYNFNAKKSHSLCFGRDECSSQKLFLGGEEIENLDGTFHMGVPLHSNDSTLLKLIAHRTDSVQREVNAIMSLGNYHTPLPPLIGKRLYRSICIPKLTYGLETCLLNPGCLTLLERAHCFCVRRLQGLPRQTPVVVPLATLGLPTIESLILYKQMILLYRWLSLPVSCIYKRIAIARIVYHLVGKGEHTGPLLNALKACQKYGLENYIIEGITGNIISLSRWKQLTWEALERDEKSRWKMSTLFYARLSLFKECIVDIDECVWWQLSRQCPAATRVARTVVRLISGEHCLSSNSHRWSRNSPSADGMCPLCSSGEPETISHLLFCCTSLSEKRKAAFQSVLEPMPTAMRLHVLELNENDRGVFLLSGMRVRFTPEWFNIYVSIAKFVSTMYGARNKIVSNTYSR